MVILEKIIKSKKKITNNQRLKRKQKNYEFIVKNTNKIGKKIIANAIARQTPYFRRPLFVNNKFSEMKIIKLKTYDDCQKYLFGIDSWDNKVCFLIENFQLKKINTKNIKVVSDIVICNSAWHVIEYFSCTLPQTTINISENAKNIWIMPKGSISVFNIEINSLLSTKP